MKSMRMELVQDPLYAARTEERSQLIARLRAVHLDDEEVDYLLHRWEGKMAAQVSVVEAIPNLSQK
jgi:hypothetical protein